MENIDITGLDKVSVLRALYAKAQPLGMGFLHYVEGPLPLHEAEALIRNGMSFDYVKGRVMKVNLSGDSFNPRLFDRDNGEGSAAAAIAALKSSSKKEEN